MDLTAEMTVLARQAREASRAMARLTTDEKNTCLRAMAQALQDRREDILAANAKDLEAGEASGLSSALMDRLELNPKRFEAMVQGLLEVADLPDPVGRVLNERTLPNGIQLQKVSTPIGVIVIIYESRPNVTADAASLCLKSGNVTILRGGREAIHSNRILAEVMVQAARQAVPAFPEFGIQVVPFTNREAIPALLSLTQYIDLCMPRGGEGLIRAVAECSRVPVIKHYKGVCHVYLDRDADPEMAQRIAINAKLHRPGVCNAMETLIVDHSWLDTLLPKLATELNQLSTTLRCDSESARCLREAGIPCEDATEEDWETEYLDRILSIRTVNGVEEAIAHINRHGSGHSDAIVTSNEETARRFLQEIDSAAVYWNVSTRFTDGGAFGMGAEIGISTDKIGARGPMGLEELTTYKWLGVGTGQIRE